jgi:hypothetical protein
MSTAVTNRETTLVLEKDFLKKLYSYIGTSKEFRTSQKKISEITGVPHHVVVRVMKVMRDQGIYVRRDQYSNTNGKGDRASYWRLVKPYREAYNALIADQSMRGEKFNTYHQEPNIPAPEPVPTESESLAQAKGWAKSAKTYMHRIEAVRIMVDELKALGMDVDETAIYEAVHLKHDEKFATIALVVPYIEHLEKSLRNLQTEFNKLKN